MSKLKRCPFCGGGAEVIETEIDWYVRCTKCSGGVQATISEQEAIRQWNTRKPMDRIVERLEKESSFFEGKPMGTLQKHYYCEGIKRAIEIVKEGAK